MSGSQSGSFKAETFEELFQAPEYTLEDFIPEDGKFWWQRLLHQEQAVQKAVGYPVDYEEGHGGAAEKPLWSHLVS